MFGAQSLGGYKMHRLNFDRLGFDRSVLVVALLSYASLILLALLVDYFYFADSAFFFFATMSGGLYDSVLRTFPTRAAALFFGLGPAWVWDRFTGQWWVSKEIYALIFLSAPVWSLLASNKIAAWRRERIWVICFLAVLPMACFGFPTETYITASALSMVLLVIIGAGASMSVMLAVAVPIFCALTLFSHEAGVVATPALACLIWREWREDRSRRFVLMHVVFWWGFFLAAWLLVRVFLETNNSMVAFYLKGNSATVFNFDYFLGRPFTRFVFLGVVGLGVLCIRQARLRWFLCMIVLLAMIQAGVLIVTRDDLVSRYASRSVVVWGCAAIPLVLAVRPQFGRRHAVLVLFLMVVMFLSNMRLMTMWNDYKEALVQRAELRLADYDFSRHSLQGQARIRKLEWQWVVPYQVALWTNADSGRALLMDLSGGYAPVNCEVARMPVRWGRFLTEAEQTEFADKICRNHELFFSQNRR